MRIDRAPFDLFVAGGGCAGSLDPKAPRIAPPGRTTVTEEEQTRSRVDARIQAEVERAVAPYVGTAPPVVLRKMRELVERYYREHPQASRIIELLDAQEQTRSGERVKELAGEPGEQADAAGERARKV